MFGIGQKKLTIKKNEILPSDWISHFNEETKFTPDVAVIETAPWAVFFIHDDMKEGMKSFSRIKDVAVKLSPGFTQDGFCFYNHKFAEDGSPLDTPVALARTTTDRIVPWADQKGSPNAHISGDLYRIRSTYVKKLDTAYENGLQFQRSRVQIRINYRKRLAFKERTQIHNIAKDYLNQHVSRAEITSPILETYFIEAWMYVGINEFWEPQIDGGLRFEPVSLVRDQKTNLIYYKYTE